MFGKMINLISFKWTLIFLLLFSSAVHAADAPKTESEKSYEGFSALAQYHSNLTDILNKANDPKQKDSMNWSAIGRDYDLPMGLEPAEIESRIREMFGIVDQFIFDTKTKMYEDPEGSMEKYHSIGKGEEYENTFKPIHDEVWNKIFAVKNARGPSTNTIDLDDFTQDDGLYGLSTSHVTKMLDQIRKQVPELMSFVVAICYVAGIFLFMHGFLKLKAYGQQTVMSSTHASFGPSMIYMLIGIILTFLPTMANITTATVMGPSGGDVAYSYYGSSDGFGFAGLTSALIGIVKLVGLIAFCKGWFILLKVGSNHGQSGVMSRGVIHIVGGIFALNIMTTWEILRATFGYVW